MATEQQAILKPTDAVPARSIWGRLFFRLGLAWSRCYTDIEYSGQAQLPAAPFMLAANHQSYLDGLWILSALNQTQFRLATAMVGADLAFDHGLIGKILMEGARAIPVERHGNPIRSLLKAKKALECGNIVLIHPEGTRSASGRLGQLHAGAAYLAYKAKAPLVPVYIDGAFRVWPRQAKLPKRRDPELGRKNHIRIEFLPALNPADFPSKEALHEALQAALKEAEQRALERRAAELKAH